MKRLLLRLLLLVAVHRAAQGHDEGSWLYSAEKIGARIAHHDSQVDGSDDSSTGDSEPKIDAHIHAMIHDEVAGKHGAHQVVVKGQKTVAQWRPYPVWKSSEESATTTTASSAQSGESFTHEYSSPSPAETTRADVRPDHHDFSSKDNHGTEKSSIEYHSEEHAATHSSTAGHSSTDRTGSSSTEELLSVHFMGHNPEDSTTATIHHSTTSFPVYATTSQESREALSNETESKSTVQDEHIHIVGHIPHDVNDMLQEIPVHPTHNTFFTTTSPTEDLVQEKVRYTMKVSKCKLTPDGEDCTSSEETESGSRDSATERTIDAKEEPHPTEVPVEEVVHSTKMTPLCHLSSIPLPSDGDIDEKTREFYLRRITQVLNCGGENESAHSSVQKQNKTSSSEEKTLSYTDLTSEEEKRLKELEAQIMKKADDKHTESLSKETENKNDNISQQSKEEGKLDIALADQEHLHHSDDREQQENQKHLNFFSAEQENIFDIGSQEQKVEKQIHSIEKLDEAIKMLDKDIPQQEKSTSINEDYDRSTIEKEHLKDKPTLLDSQKPLEQDSSSHDHKIEVTVSEAHVDDQKQSDYDPIPDNSHKQDSSENQENLSVPEKQKLLNGHHNTENDHTKTELDTDLHSENVDQSQSKENHMLISSILGEVPTQTEITHSQTDGNKQTGHRELGNEGTDLNKFEFQSEKPIQFNVNQEHKIHDTATYQQDAGTLQEAQKHSDESKAEHSAHGEIKHSTSQENHDPIIEGILQDQAHQSREQDFIENQKVNKNKELNLLQPTNQKEDINTTDEQKQLDITENNKNQEQASHEKQTHSHFDSSELNGQDSDESSSQDNKKLGVSSNHSEEQKASDISVQHTTNAEKHIDAINGQEVQKQMEIINKQNEMKVKEITLSQEILKSEEVRQEQSEGQKKFDVHMKEQAQLETSNEDQIILSSTRVEQANPNLSEERITHKSENSQSHEDHTSSEQVKVHEEHTKLEQNSPSDNENQKMLPTFSSQEQLKEEISALQQEIEKNLKMELNQNDQSKIDFDNSQTHEKVEKWDSGNDQQKQSDTNIFSNNQEIQKIIMSSLNDAQHKEDISDKIPDSQTSTTKPIVNVVTEISVHHTSGNRESKKTSEASENVFTQTGRAISDYLSKPWGYVKRVFTRR